MSYSRLEKFIYAICSMEVSDLPAPLSRIETLWNCLITGETPDFEPLSRNEKYLMAMLDRYDISNLPAPMSRGEKLLYKIAVGETDLSDVPGYLSRYEELLKYLIENGGISEGDFEYVLYTLNQSMYTLYTTAEKPVKSAILKGQTLVNLFRINQEKEPSGSVCGYKNGKLQFVFGDWDYSYTSGIYRLQDCLPLVKDKKYYYRLELSRTPLVAVAINSHNVTTHSDLYRYTTYNTESSNQTIFTGTFIANEHDRVGVRVDDGKNGETITGTFMVLEYIEGMENWDIPYFTGMQSVKMPVLTTTGKNLFDGELISGYYEDGSLSKIIGSTSNLYKTIRLNLKKGTYTFSFEESVKFIRQLKDGVYDTIGGDYTNFTTTLQTDGTYVLSFRKTDNSDFDLTKIQIEQGSTPSSYESFKSNILTVNEEVELRGIGDVKDELDLLTGEVIENTYKYTLTGNESISLMSSSDTNTTFKIEVPNIKLIARNAIGVLSDNFLSVSFADHALDMEKIFRWDTTRKQIGLTIKNTKASTVEELRVWLSTNEINLVYLCDNTIKTVDLTVVNQDNQPTQLGTFENVTHVSLEAENLIPEVEMEVATNLLEDTVFNLTNAFNTLYPTAEKPVKSAILSGQTLVNYFPEYTKNMKIGTGGWRAIFNSKLNISLTPNTSYVFVNNSNIGVKLNVSIKGETTAEKNVISNLTTNIVKFTTPDNIENFTRMNVYLMEDNTSELIYDSFMVIPYQEGMENWDIPYFTGMQSVKMPVLTTTGKNLFDYKSYGGYDTKVVEIENGLRVSGWAKRLPFTHNLLPNTTYTSKSVVRIVEEHVGAIDTGAGKIMIYNGTTYLQLFGANGREYTFTTPSDIKNYDRILFYAHGGGGSKDGVVDITSMQLEETSSATSYEPHKSNILTTPEDLELRGIGDVKDELNLLTGEVTERIGEIVLDGSENWIESNRGQEIPVNTIRFAIVLNDDALSSLKIITDNFPLSNITSYNTDLETIQTTGGTLYIRILKSKLSSVSVDGFKAWLSQNPITVQYPLATESIKTVDLTVVNQDGNETKLRTFDDTTHVLLNSEGLVPTASLTVRTKIPSASTTSLLMDDISKEQQQLSETIDEQTNNVDAAMVATTEIYEETL